eukprot:m.823921 g.823921  ORF g.823921 m.823921 type:complete len:118 (-) comp23405_c0_seq19:584-937(-)
MDGGLSVGTACPFVDLAAGRDMLLRDVGVSIESSRVPPPMLRAAAYTPPAVGPQDPYVALRNKVSGKFYGLPLDGIFGGEHADSGGPLHVLILVANTSGTIATCPFCPCRCHCRTWK